MFNYLRFRYRRALRRLRRDTRTLRKWAGNYIDRHIWGKWHQLGVVRRFLLGWFGVLAVGFVGLTQQINLLNRAAQVAVPVTGGTYSEAAVGTVTTLNPVLPESELSDDVNRLIFSGLTRFNNQRQVVPDLAERWEVSSDGRTYTFYLRPGVKWQDGVPFTAADVAFTLTAIQNPDSRSPLASSWQGVKVETRGDNVVVFTLPAPLASFMDSTTLEIVPRHLLESIDPSQLREADFNHHPIGTGPFMVKTFAPAAHEITLAANSRYYGGRPKLDEFTFRLYDNDDQALDAYAQHQVISPGRIRPEQLGHRNQLAGLTDYNFTLPEEAVLFFHTTDGPLADKTLRGILTQALNRPKILDQATDGQGVVVTQPILPGQTGYTNASAPAKLNIAAAKQALAADGWTASKPLKLNLVTQSGGELERAAQEIKRQLATLGVQVALTATDATTLQQTYMRPRNFQMLLYGINVGPDPDVYSFWHSSQAQDPGVNLSGYASADADKALEAGRIKTDPALREAKYTAFLKAWNADAPAAVLYQTGYQYAVSADADGITPGRLVVPSDRFYGVERWTIKRRWVDIKR